MESEITLPRPKMPHKIKDLHAQILSHTNYNSLSSCLRFCFEGGCVGHLSWMTKENNRWSRVIWKHLYWGESLDGDDAV